MQKIQKPSLPVSVQTIVNGMNDRESSPQIRQNYYNRLIDIIQEINLNIERFNIDHDDSHNDSYYNDSYNDSYNVFRKQR